MEFLDLKIVDKSKNIRFCCPKERFSRCCSPRKSHERIIANPPLRKAADRLSRKTTDIGPGNLDSRLPRCSTPSASGPHAVYTRHPYDADFTRSTNIRFELLLVIATRARKEASIYTRGLYRPNVRSRHP